MPSDRADFSDWLFVVDIPNVGGEHYLVARDLRDGTFVVFAPFHRGEARFEVAQRFKALANHVGESAYLEYGKGECIYSLARCVTKREACERAARWAAERAVEVARERKSLAV